MASEDGARRGAAMPSMLARVSPATKRAALTFPARYFAARSGRAGVRRGSSIAFAQQFVDRTRRLAFAAFGPRRFCGGRPAIDIDMQPAFRCVDEPLQEQPAGDGARETAGCRVIDVGHFCIEPPIVTRPSLHTPHTLVPSF